MPETLAWIQSIGVAALVLLALLKVRLVGWRPHRWPVHAPGMLLFLASIPLPYPLWFRDQSWSIHGFAFMVLALDEAGRDFVGMVSLVALLANFFPWRWFVQVGFAVGRSTRA